MVTVVEAPEMPCQLRTVLLSPKDPGSESTVVPGERRTAR